MDPFLPPLIWGQPYVCRSVPEEVRSKRMNVCGEQEWMLAIWLSKRRMMKKWWFSGCYQNMIALAKSDIRDTQIACHIDVTQNFGPPRRNGLTSDSRRTVAVSSLTRQSESWRTVAVVSLTRQSWFQLWRFPIAAVRETSLLSGPKNKDEINESPAKEGMILSRALLCVNVIS